MGKPKPNDLGAYDVAFTKNAPISSETSVPFTVKRVEGNLCYATYHWKSGDVESVFIWRFKDNDLNSRHWWPDKDIPYE